MVINKGEITTIIGPNGAGKSSLIRLILGLIKPDEGSIEKSNNLTIGYMPQTVKIDPTLPISTYRFLELANTSHAQCDKALQLVGISEARNTPFHKLSGGEKQRALLARAILCQPNLLVLDEPVQGVDFNGQNALYGLIAEHKSSIVAAGALCTKRSPEFPFKNAYQTRSIASFKDIKNLVIFGSVMVNDFSCFI